MHSLYRIGLFRGFITLAPYAAMVRYKMFLPRVSVVGVRCRYFEKLLLLQSFHKKALFIYPLLEKNVEYVKIPFLSGNISKE